jgi:hypothetical protein
VRLITTLRANMCYRLKNLSDKLLLHKLLFHKRVLIETIHDQLKNVSQIEHTWRRSSYNFLMHLLTDLIAYRLRPKKLSRAWISIGSPQRNFSGTHAPVAIGILSLFPRGAGDRLVCTTVPPPAW